MSSFGAFQAVAGYEDQLYEEGETNRMSWGELLLYQPTSNQVEYDHQPFYGADSEDSNGLYMFQDNPFHPPSPLKPDEEKVGGQDSYFDYSIAEELDHQRGGGGGSSSDPSSQFVRRSIASTDPPASSGAWGAPNKSQQSTVADFADYLKPATPYSPIGTGETPWGAPMPAKNLYAPCHPDYDVRGAYDDPQLYGTESLPHGAPQSNDGAFGTSTAAVSPLSFDSGIRDYEVAAGTPIGAGPRKMTSRRKSASNPSKRSSAERSPIGKLASSNVSSKRRMGAHSALSEFTSQDENGKRRIKTEIMNVAAELPPLPGLYFDKKQKGFRVRYQNVYVGWVALSRFKSVEQAYTHARTIWENAKSAAEKYHTPQAAIIASIPLQNEAKAAGKNRGGRPRTVTQVPEDESFYDAATAAQHHNTLMMSRNWAPRDHGRRPSTVDYSIAPPPAGSDAGNSQDLWLSQDDSVEFLQGCWIQGGYNGFGYPPTGGGETPSAPYVVTSRAIATSQPASSPWDSTSLADGSTLV